MPSTSVWAITGISTSSAVGRQIAYAALGGKEGVSHATALKPSQMDTPGGGVKVLPGGVAAVSQYTDASDAGEMYYDSLESATNVTINSTGSGSSRTDLVVWRFEDANSTDGVWGTSDSTLRVIENIGQYTGSPTTVTKLSQLGLQQTGFAIARVTLPPSTAAVTDAMITDLRGLAAPKEEDDDNNGQYPCSGSQAMPTGSYATWPTEASWSVNIPSWAVWAHISVTADGTLEATGASACEGTVRIRLGSNTVASRTIKGSNTVQRGQWTISTYFYLVPSLLRGTTQPLKVEALQTAGAGQILIDTKSAIHHRTKWREHIL